MKLPHKSWKWIAVMIAVLAIIGVGSTQTSAIAAPFAVASSTSAHPVLRYGAHGASVKTLQSDLNRHGARLVVDGQFGPATLGAVKSFQRSRHLVVDGIVGPYTWAALGSGSNPKPAPTSNLTKLGITQAAINGARATGRSMDISKRTHMLYMLRSSGGKVYVEHWSVVSFAGCNADGCFTTPSGVFHVTYKGGPNEHSRIWHNASMPYPVYFTWTGYAVHYDPLEPSHGCIHVPEYALMRTMNAEMQPGDVLVVHS